jgi:hypothetical protein
LSLLECTEQNFHCLNLYLEKFKTLKSLHIVQSASNEAEWAMKYLIIERIRNSILNNSFDMLIELELTINGGIILDKHLYPNEHLKQLTITLQNISDLYILFDGFAPNLIILNITVCQPDVYKRLSLPQSWPRQFMSHLVEFQLITNENVALTFDQLRNIVMPLIKLNKLTLIVRQWISNDQQFVQGNQLQMLIHQFMLQLHHFHCSIMTMNNIDMQVKCSISQLINFIRKISLNFF